MSTKLAVGFPGSEYPRVYAGVAVQPCHGGHWLDLNVLGTRTPTAFMDDELADATAELLAEHGLCVPCGGYGLLAPRPLTRPDDTPAVCPRCQGTGSTRWRIETTTPRPGVLQTRLVRLDDAGVTAEGVLMAPWDGGPLRSGEILLAVCPVCGVGAEEGIHTYEDCRRRLAARKTRIIGIFGGPPASEA